MSENRLEGVRLNKWIADSGYCSRREADRLIEDKKVTIDGKPGTLGDRVLPGMKVCVNGKPVGRQTHKVYIALNKPEGVVSATEDGHLPCVTELLPSKQPVR